MFQLILNPIRDWNGKFIIDEAISDIAFLIYKRYIPNPKQLNQQRFKCAAQMREPL